MFQNEYVVKTRTRRFHNKIWFSIISQILAEALLTNGLGRACRQLTVNGGTGINPALQEVLVHFNIVLRCCDNTTAISPFWQMLHQTNQMQVQKPFSGNGAWLFVFQMKFSNTRSKAFKWNSINLQILLRNNLKVTFKIIKKIPGNLPEILKFLSFWKNSFSFETN